MVQVQNLRGGSPRTQAHPHALVAGTLFSPTQHCSVIWMLCFIAVVEGVQASGWLLFKLTRKSFRAPRALSCSSPRIFEAAAALRTRLLLT